MPKTSSSMPQNLTRMNPGGGAIDIGSTMHIAAVNPDYAPGAIVDASEVLEALRPEHITLEILND